MKPIDDSTFMGFVNNELSHEEMCDVEKDLIENGEIASTLYASAINYDLNEKIAMQILGLDEEINPKQKNSQKNDRLAKGSVSIKANNPKNNILMNLNLTLDEAKRVNNLYNAIAENEKKNQDLSLNEILVACYLDECPEATADEAQKIVADLRKGIDKFNEDLNNELKGESVDYIARIDEVTKDRTNEEKYEIYLNFLAALNVMDVNNFTPEEAEQISDFQLLKKALKVEGEVTDEMLDELIAKVKDAIENNTLCLTSLEAMNKIVEAVPEGEAAVEDALRGSEADLHNKLVAAAALYISAAKGEISGLNLEEVPAEVVGVAAASGMEQLKALNDYQKGKITKEKVIAILKKIGKVALWLTVTAVFAYASLLLASFVFGLFLGCMGASTFVLIFAGVVAMAAGLNMFLDTSKAREKVINWTETKLGQLANYWQETAWPAIRTKAEELITWIKGLFSSNKVKALDKETDTEVVTA